MQITYKNKFGFWILLLLVWTLRLSSQTPNSNLTPGGANGMVFRFTKQVWLNPTVILAKQKFEQATNVKLLILPRTNASDTSNNNKIEKAFDKLLAFLVFKENIQGSIKFYFNPKNPSKPFSFDWSEDLQCKFNKFHNLYKDTIEGILNNGLVNHPSLNNFAALPFDSIIGKASRYCRNILLLHPAPCGENQNSEFDLAQINSTPAKLEFAKVNTTSLTYNGGYDILTYNELEAYYNTVTDLADGSTYKVGWKAIKDDDILKLKLTKKQPSFDVSKLVFKNAKGTVSYNVSVNPDSTLSLSMGGQSPGSMAEVVAYYTPTTTPVQTYPIGAFNVKFYEPKIYNLVLVSLDANPLPLADQSKLKDSLNKIYGPVFIQWNLSQVRYNLPTTVSKSIHDASSGLLSNYMPDMQPIVSSFKNNSSAYNGNADNTVYIILGASIDNTEIKGYMPRARNTGFVFVQPEVSSFFIRTLAHEVGHGAFNLKHIFSSDELGEGNKTQTNNLMDYASGRQLYKHQWDLIHDPSFVGWFEGDDEEGALVAGYNCNESNVPANLKILAERAKLCDNKVSVDAEAYSESQFSPLCITQRVNLIKCILKNDWVDGDDETTIIKLIKSTPNDQITLLFANMSMNNNELLTTLMLKLNNLFGADNYTQFFLEINTLFAKINNKKDNKIFYWGVSNQPDVNSGSILSVSIADKKIKVQGNYSFKINKPNDLTPTDYIRVDTTLDLFSPIILTYFAPPSQANIGQIAPGKVYTVPAIFLKFVHDNVWNGIMENVTYDVIDLAGSAVGISQIRYAKNLSNIFNIGITSLNSINYVIKSPTTRQNLINSGHSDFLFYWDRSVALANVAYLSPHAYKFFKGLTTSFRTSSNALQTELNPNQIQEIETTVTRLEQEISTVSHGVGSGAEDIANFYTLDRAMQSKNLVEQFNLTQFANAATKDEVVAIHRYTVNNFELTVSAYRGNYTAVQQSWMNLIKSGMVKLSPANKFVGKVYRGSNLSSSNLQPFLDAWASTNKTIKIPPVQSTSKLESVANHFINKFKAPGKSEVMFEIQSKTGIYIDDISDYGKKLGPTRHPSDPIQEEVLLFDNKDFEITNLQTVTKTDGTIRYVIEMKEL